LMQKVLGAFLNCLLDGPNGGILYGKLNL
jgi:hypothetical protein